MPVDTLPVVGTTAPDFTLPSTAGEALTLSSFRGDRHVLLAFFPLAFTGTCTAEVNEFSHDFEQYQSRGAVVLPISVDSIPTLKAFRKQEGLGIDLLSDFKREVSRRYGVLDEDRFDSRRAYFLVDRDGVLRWSLVESVRGDKRTTAELIAQLDALG